MPLLTRRSSRARDRDAGEHRRRGSPRARPRASPPASRRSSSCDDATKVYPGGHVGLERVSLRDRPRRVRLPRRPDRLRQVDPDQAC